MLGDGPLGAPKGEVPLSQLEPRAKWEATSWAWVAPLKEMEAKGPRETLGVCIGSGGGELSHLKREFSAVAGYKINIQNPAAA